MILEFSCSLYTCAQDVSLIAIQTLYFEFHLQLLSGIFPRNKPLNFIYAKVFPSRKKMSVYLKGKILANI